MSIFFMSLSPQRAVLNYFLTHQAFASGAASAAGYATGAFA
jgi:hypothetical protein